MSNTDRKPVVETIKLNKVFRDFWHRDKVKAVNNLTLRIYPGEVFGLLGPNGSGKTTTLKIILGLLFPSSGLVRIFGHSPRNVAVKSRIGFLPEESYFYRHLSARETMDFYGALFELPASERRKRGDRLLELLGLLPSQSRPVGEYSKGMARRIGLAQALLNDPDLIILDEPTSGLDPIGRREVKNLIIELKKMGKTVLLSSHLLSEVQDVCDRICILYAGEKIAEGGVDEVLLKRELMQLQVPADSPRIKEKVMGLLAEEISRGEIKMTNPVETLEEFFLREIAELEKKRTAARAPSAAEEPEDKRTVIEKLASGDAGGEDAPSGEDAGEKPGAGSGRKPAEALESLTKEDAVEPERGEEPSPGKKSGEILRKLSGDEGA